VVVAFDYRLLCLMPGVVWQPGPTTPAVCVLVFKALFRACLLQAQYDVFSESEVVRAFNIAHAAHDGRYRESGEPAFMHCVEVCSWK
jgi:hypothetical protein